jgi:hypothetical protein
MKNIKKATALIAVMCMVIGVLSGCTNAASGKALYDAMVKAQSIKSSQNDIEYSLRLDAAGLSEEDMAQFEQIKAVLNNAKMSMSMKQTANADNTAIKAEVDMNMYFGEMSMDMGVWVDMDLDDTEPKFIEIVKIPAMLTAMDPTMAGKEYMVMDLAEMMNTPDIKNQIPMADNAETMKLLNELQDKTTAFLAKYLAQYDPGFNFITDAGTKDIVTPEGTVKAHIYQVKLDDKSAKKLIRYTVNNFADNEDAMVYAVEYMKFIQEFAVTAPGGVNPFAELDKMMAEFESNKPELLAEFNSMMDELEGIQLVGDKGITLEYAIDENGYIISQSGSMDFIFDTESLEGFKGVKDNNPASAGVYNLGIDFSMLTYNINEDMNIEMPIVTSENSIDLNEMSRAAMQTQPEQTLKAIPTASKVLVNGQPISFDAYTIDGNNYFKLRDLAKAVNGTQKQFDVTWDGENETINLISQKAYTIVGGEMVPGDGSEKAPVLNTSKIYKDGEEVSLNAYTINGNNYFKLRDIAQAFDIGITWDETTNTIGIDTNTGYVAP